MNKINIDTEQDIQKAKKKALIVLALFPLFLIVFIPYGIYWVYFDMSHLPKEKVLTESTSPDGIYTVKVYLINGGATTAYAVLGELSFNQERRKPKYIYFNHREDYANLNWLDNDTIIINGHKLEVPYETFDYRRD
ncbi:DUF5412 domain-containing protein [Desulforamulus aeronauticus]|uniref:DUF5412 domain-containing protein n=1 Tax=Desulforamulus aeronauticus DSM 10349 TaxID=1121421 RepID=A0A1M6QBT6_9FIRM|nr:DUF5412 domain-containing protein [Desulforamulus aeronauticus]SHK17638.1 hypothetical protein SAMN02745123_00949 [Desulforamulus aeronauticus DSM 10349]